MSLYLHIEVLAYSNHWSNLIWYLCWCARHGITPPDKYHSPQLHLFIIVHSIFTYSSLHAHWSNIPFSFIHDDPTSHPVGIWIWYFITHTFLFHSWHHYLTRHLVATYILWCSLIIIMVLISLNYRNGILALVFQWALFFLWPLLHVAVSYMCIFTIMLIVVFQSHSIQQPQLLMLLYCSTMADLAGCMHPWCTTPMMALLWPSCVY